MLPTPDGGAVGHRAAPGTPAAVAAAAAAACALTDLRRAHSAPAGLDRQQATPGQTSQLCQAARLPPSHLSPGAVTEALRRPTAAPRRPAVVLVDKAPVPADTPRPFTARLRPDRTGSSPGAATLRCSRLTAADGTCWFVSECIAERQGTFGKFRYGIDAHGEALAVKEYRTQPPRRRLRGSSRRGPKTCVSRWEDIEGEAAAIASFGRRLQACALLQVRRTGKVMLFMTLFDGTLQSVAPAVRASMRDHLAAYMMLGVTGCAARMHACPAVHGDIKPANIGLGAQGFTLLDFGKARRLQGDERGLRLDGSAAYMAPEMFFALRGPPAARPAAVADGGGPAADVWASFLSIMALYNRGSPFAGCSLDSPQHAWPVYDEYVDWHRLRVGAGGLVDLDGIVCGEATFDRYFAPLARAWPVACAHVLARPGHPDPGRRSTMAEEHAFWRAQCAAPARSRPPRLRLALDPEDRVVLRPQARRAGEYGRHECRTLATTACDFIAGSVRQAQATACLRQLWAHETCGVTRPTASPG